MSITESIAILATAADQQVATPLEQLDPPTRAMVLMVLLGLVLTGLVLIVLTAIGARWLRKVLRERKPPRQWPHRHDVQPDAPGNKASEQPSSDDPPASETLVNRPPSNDTRSD